MDAGLGVRNTQLWACGKAEHTDEIRENMSTQKQARIHWKMGRNYSKRILNYIFYKWFCFANMRRHKRGHMPRQKRDWYISTRTGHLHIRAKGGENLGPPADKRRRDAACVIREAASLHLLCVLYTTAQTCKGPQDCVDAPFGAGPGRLDAYEGGQPHVACAGYALSGAAKGGGRMRRTGQNPIRRRLPPSAMRKP